MEETIGKRIAFHRKRLGMTQDQLAEQLGVTAQAVSKWENDQSCPDINTLPRLADLFGISVDALLGREEPVCEAEIVQPQQEENRRTEKGGWEFSWDAGRRNGVFFALFVLLVGCLSLAAALLQWDVSFWSILWPCALLFIGIRGLVPHFSFFSLGCTLFGGYFLLENLNVLHLNLGLRLVLPIMVVLFGLSLLADALRKKNSKPTVHFQHNGKSNKKEASFSMNDDCFSCETSFGSNRHLINLPVLRSGSAECSFGELTVDLSGVEALAENCSLNADCSFGELTILVPRRFTVEPYSDTTFAAFNIIGEAVNPVGVIRLSASVNFGEIKVRYL